MLVRKDTTQRGHRVPRLILAMTIAPGLAGCGSDDERTGSPVTVTTPAPPPRQTLHIAADPQGALRFRPAKLTARAGEVAIVMTNPKTSGRQHGVGLVGPEIDLRGITVAPGRLSEAAAELQPGDYAYYCTVPSHRKAGMRGRLEVR